MTMLSVSRFIREFILKEERNKTRWEDTKDDYPLVR